MPAAHLFVRRDAWKLAKGDHTLRWYAHAVAIMQADGNFVIYDSTGAGIWSSGTPSHSGAYLAVQNDGNVVVYSSAGVPVWATNTCCH